MTFQGRLDAVAADAITGWVRDIFDPERTLEVILESDGEIVASTLADLPRDDLRTLKSPRDCGFAFSLHDVSVADPASLKVKVAGEGWLIGENPIFVAQPRDERTFNAALAPLADRQQESVRLPVRRQLVAQQRLWAEVDSVEGLLAELRAVLARSIIATAESPATADRLRAALGRRALSRAADEKNGFNRTRPKAAN